MKSTSTAWTPPEKSTRNETTTPWVEKYRPSRFNDIVLDPLNRQLFTQMLEKNYFPHLLFYGPPGTGKTTSIINIINEYQTRNGVRSNSTIMHLNASDERGIDIIRNQIYLFAKTMNLFESGLKFVILDEVDYMTKNAQQALKYILQTSNYHVRFCLVCNYITKIDESLKNEFVCVRFNQLPRQDVHAFLRKICNNERKNCSGAEDSKAIAPFGGYPSAQGTDSDERRRSSLEYEAGGIPIRDDTLYAIQDMYHSDIRSMINYLQLHQTNVGDLDVAILGDSVLEDIYQFIRNFTCMPPVPGPVSASGSGSGPASDKQNIEQLCTYFRKLSIQYNIDHSSMIKKFMNYMIRNHTTEMIQHDRIDRMGVLMHCQRIPTKHALEYIYYLFRV